MPVMSVRIFEKLAELVERSAGIKMPAVKKTMLEGRLRKRLRAVGLNSFDEYCKYVFSDAGMKTELISLLDVVTTNKTDFFREPFHFEYLTTKSIPELLTGCRLRKIRVWSAGCSTGEEPYTLAIVLSELLEKTEGFSFSILATDLSTEVIEKARNAIYSEERISGMPDVMKKKYFMKSRDRNKRLVRVVPELRNSIEFFRINFMDDVYPVDKAVNVVFCRNVLIYFDRIRQQKILSNLCSRLTEGGYLFIGHSETTAGLDLPIKQVAPTVYRKLAA